MEQKKREVRRLTPKDMEDYIEIYLNAYPAGKDLSDECREKYYKRNLQSLQEFDHVNSFGLFEDDHTLIATMKLIDFDINLFGEMRKACGLMALAVHPLHKKKGAARDMVRFFERYTVESGAAVAMLLPFRVDFYRRMGYGCSTSLEEYHIRTDYLPKWKPNQEDGSASIKLKFLGKDSVDQVLACHRRFVGKYHGAVCKFEEEIRDLREDDGIRRIGAFRGDELAGYAAFAFVNTSPCNYTCNLMDIKELVYEDKTVLQALLGGLRMQGDLAQSVILRSGEPDFYHVLDSCQDLSDNYIDFGFMQTNVSALGTMYKIPKMSAFVEAAAHRQFPPMNVTVGFCVYDELAGEEKRFALQFAENTDKTSSHWSYTEAPEAASAAEVQVSCRLSDLSSLLMGSAEFGGMARLGLMTVSDPGWVRPLDRLFHAEQKPFTNTDYRYELIDPTDWLYQEWTQNRSRK